MITNGAAFERVLADSAADLTLNPAGGKQSDPKPDPAGWTAAAAHSKAGAGAARPASHRLAVRPRYDTDAGDSHGCPLCPANLCKVRPRALCPMQPKASELPRCISAQFENLCDRRHLPVLIPTGGLA